MGLEGPVVPSEKVCGPLGKNKHTHNPFLTLPWRRQRRLLRKALESRWRRSSRRSPPQCGIAVWAVCTPITANGTIVHSHIRRPCQTDPKPEPPLG